MNGKTTARQAMRTDHAVIADGEPPPVTGTAVLTGPGGRVVAISVDGRRQAGIEVRPDRTLASVIADGFLVGRLNAGLDALVVAENGVPLGLLPAEHVIAVLAADYTPDTGLMGDDDIGGRPVVDPIRVVCTTCSTANTYAEIDVGVTECYRGHVLTIDWG